MERHSNTIVHWWGIFPFLMIVVTVIDGINLSIKIWNG